MFLEILVLILFFLILSVLIFLVFIFKKIDKKKDDSSILLFQDRLDKISKNQNEFSEKISEKISGGQKEISESVEKQLINSQNIIKEVTKELGDVKNETKKVSGFSEQLKSLQEVLQNSKQRGALGEYFLESTIENILPPENYEFQYLFKDGTQVDAVVKLKDGIIPIDSKFSLENYNKIIEENNPEAKKELEKKFKEDLKKRINETAKYIKPKENTMDFAFMFIPSEGIYYDLLISKVGTVDSENFLEYAFRQKKVIVVSPSTLYAYLQTVMQGLKSLKIEKKTGEIIKKVGDLEKHLSEYEKIHSSIGNSLNATVNHYNSSNKKFRKIDKDILKITDGERDLVEIEDLEKIEKNE